LENTKSGFLIHVTRRVKGYTRYVYPSVRMNT